MMVNLTSKVSVEKKITSWIYVKTAMKLLDLMTSSPEVLSFLKVVLIAFGIYFNFLPTVFALGVIAGVLLVMKFWVCTLLSSALDSFVILHV